jgi:NADPH-dependent curcumin reductase
MSAEMNRRVVLRRRPMGWVTSDDFELQESGMPQPVAGEVLLRANTLSLDPYMRGRMNDGPSYAPPVALGDVMAGEVVGQVIESRAVSFSPGDWVAAHTGWQTFGVARASEIRPVDLGLAEPAVHLSALGMPGVAAWVGLTRIAPVKAGDTVYVSAATGAVGSVVVQLAKARGCRVIGSAGGFDKCRYAMSELGADVCLDYQSESFWPQLKASAPDGVDVLFENVGGPIMDIVFRKLNRHARVALCGLVSQYNGAPHPSTAFGPLLVQRVNVRGFIVHDHLADCSPAIEELSHLFRAGRLKQRETVFHGLEAAPQAFIDMLAGKKIGKTVVQLG